MGDEQNKNEITQVMNGWGQNKVAHLVKHFLIIVFRGISLCFTDHVYYKLLSSKLFFRLAMRVCAWEEGCFDAVSKRTFSEATYTEHKWIPIGGLRDMYTFHDEKCRDVIQYNRRGPLWQLARMGRGYPLHSSTDCPVSFSLEPVQDGYRFIADETKERWINLVSREKLPESYALDFDLIPHSLFVEQCQIAFAMQSLETRHRFVIEFNKRAYYQKVYRWKFLHELKSHEISFEIHKPLHVHFEIVSNVFVLLLNGHVVFCVRDKSYLPSKAYNALVFWNGWLDKDGGCRPMDFEIKNFMVSVL